MSVHGDVVTRMQCPECQAAGGDSSADNLVVYESGYAKCFACDHFEYDKITPTGQPIKKKPPIPFIQDVTIRPLTKRGIKEEVCRHYGYGYGKFYDQTVQVAPFRDDTGSLLGQKLRFPNKSFVWTGLSTRRFFGQHLYSKGKRLAITEGEIDCLSVSQVIGTKWPVVSLPSGAGLNKVKGVIEENIQYLRGFDEIVLFMDADDEGEAALKAFAEVLPGKCLAARYPDGYKDANALLVDGREADIKNSYWNATTIDDDDDIKSGDDYSYEDFIKAAPVGYSMPHPGLQEAMGGLRKGELTLFTAGSGVGKSTTVKEWGYHLMKEHGLKIGNVFMEEQDNKSFQSYVALALNVKLAELRLDPKKYVSEERFNEVKAKLRGLLEFAQQSAAWEFEKLQNKLEYMAVGKKCDFIILDHISMAVAGIQTEDERKAIDLLMSRLYQIIDRTGVGIIAVVHLRKPDGDKDWTDGLIPTANSLRGSGGLAQMSFNIVAASRNATDDDERYFTYLHLLKCREWGENAGRCTDKLQFNKVTGRLDPVEKFPESPNPKGKKKQSSQGPGFPPVVNEDF